MDNEEKMRAETIAMLRAVLISSPRGVPFEKLYREYEKLTGKTIPYKELGFQRLEKFIESIPDVARAEKGPSGEWTLKGIPSNEDKHVAKLISKQKKPKVRKSAKLFAKKPFRLSGLSVKSHTPVRRPPPKAADQNERPPRFRNFSGNVLMKRHLSNAVDQRQKGIVKQKMSISITNSGRTVRTVSNVNTSPLPKTEPAKNDHSTNILNDPVVVKWMKNEVEKVPNGLWATRLPFLYEEHFKKAFKGDITAQLKLRPDIVKMEEPIPGRLLLYAAVKQKHSDVPSATKSSSDEKDFARKVSEEVPKQVTKESQKKTREATEPANLNQLLDVNMIYIVPEIGSCLQVYITEIINGGDFYVSKTDNISEDLNGMICDHYQDSKYDPSTIGSIEPGQIFCAQFTEDQGFYRARVLEIMGNNHVKVQYLEFGNKEIIRLEDLRVVDSKFYTQPVQSLHCSLDGVQPLDEEENWNEASFKLFCNLAFDKELKMTVKDCEDKLLYVSLADPSSNIDIGEELLKAGLVASSIKTLSPSSSSSSLSSNTGVSSEKSTPPKKDGLTMSRRLKAKLPGKVEIPNEQYIDVLVCNITGTYDVFLRLVGDEYSKKFDSLQEAMTLYYSDSKDEVATEPAVGDLFAMLSDEVWCRVKVVNINGPTITVYFVDHGDTAETTKADLRTLATQFQKLPLQVFEAALAGLPKTKNPDVVDKLMKLAMGEVCVAKIIKRNVGFVFIDLIVLDSKSDAQIRVNNMIRQFVIPDEDLKPELPKVGDSVEVNIPYISPTGNVYIHVVGTGTKRLEELNEDLTEHYKSKQSKANEFVSNLTVDKVCCARTEDGNWYRVKILSASNKDAVKVYFVDYGNCDNVPSTNLREPTQVNDHVLSLPFQALECQLYDVPKSDWNEEFANKMMEIIHQGSVITAEVLSEGDLPSISLLVTIPTKEEEEITERLTTLMGIPYDEEDVKDATGSEQFDQDKTDDGEENLKQSVEESHNSDVNVDEKSDANDTGTGKRDLNINTENNIENTEVSDTQVAQEIKVTDMTQKPEVGGSEKAQENELKAGTECFQDIQEGGAQSGQVVPGAGIEAANIELVNKIVKKSAVKPLQLDVGWLDVYVTVVKDPDHFSFQLLKNLNEFYDMNKKLNDHYQNTGEKDNDLVEGEIYAVFKEDHDYWYRAIVQNITADDKAYVVFVDFGDTTIIDVENVQPLEEEFLALPFQCVQASLAGVVPKITSEGTKPKWSKDCVFSQLTLEKQLVAKITNGETNYNFGPTSRVTVELYDTSNPMKDISIAETLIETNHADLKPT